METNEVSAIYAGLWLRFVAAVIDALLLFTPLFVITFVYVHDSGEGHNVIPAKKTRTLMFPHSFRWTKHEER